MSDGELLELAAKAAGIEWFGYYGDDAVECQFLDIGTNAVVPWNPLTDDGDALRLAVKLNMTLAVGIARSDAGEFTEFDMCDTDPDAATRRAIVRAAAEIGRNMT